MPGDDLSKKSLKELRQLAAALGIRGRSGLKKAGLVKAIAAADQAPAPVPAGPPPGASETRAAPAPAEDGATGEPGLPIPDGYDQDTLTLMVQDPTHIFAYWEISADTLAATRTELGEDGLPVLLVHSKYGQEQRVVDLAGGNYYLCISPDTAYRADLGLRDSKGRIRLLASSETVHTPKNTISDRTDERWANIDEPFAELLSLAGLDQPIGSSADLAGDIPGGPALSPLSSHSLSSGALRRREPPGHP